MSLPSGCGPNSIVFASATKAYVTASDAPNLYIIDPETMTVTGSIDISAMADDDGDPDQYQAMIKEDDDRLYVTLRRSSGRSLSDHSSLAVIDTTTDTVIDELILQTNGVSGMAQDALGGQTGGEDTCSGDIYVHVGGSMTKADDGAVEKVDTAAVTSSVVVAEPVYGGTITTWVFDSNTTGWAIAGLSVDKGGEGFDLLRFDLDTGAFTPVSSFQNQIYSYALDYTDDGFVLVGDKDENTYGVRVYDSVNNYAERFAEPLDVGLIPNRILVLR
jgi:DNA-binding beta-propeller fold protein YncE